MASNRTASFQQSLSAVAPTNFLNNGHAEANTAYWDVYADAAGLVPVDGDLGSPNVVLTRTTTLPLLGDGSFLLTKDAANRQGEGASTAFGIGVKDQSHVINIDFDYSVVSGTFAYNGGTVASPSDIAVYVYDMINNVLIYPSQSFLDGSGKYHGQFQSASNSTVYRLILHIPTTSASAWAFKFDNVQAWRGPVQSGAVMSDWISFTPTGTWVSNTTYTGKYRRVGDSLELSVKVQCTGLPTATPLKINLPSGLSIDTSKTLDASVQSFTTGGYFEDAGVQGYWTPQVLALSSTTQLSVSYAIAPANALGVPVTVGAVTQALPFAFNTGDYIFISVTGIPIVGWSSNLVVSSDYGNRVITAAAEGTITGPFNGTGNIVWPTEKYDTTASYNNSTGIFTAPETGFFQFDVGVGFTMSPSTNQFFTLAPITTGTVFVQGSLLYRAVSTFGSDSKSYATLAYMTAGSTIAFRATTNITSFAFGSEGSYFNVHKVQSPQTLAGGEVMAFQGRNTAGTLITTSLGIVPFSVVKDTHGSWSTNQYSVSETGYYDMAWSLYTNGVTLGTTGFFVAAVFVDGVEAILGFDNYGNGALVAQSTNGSTSAYYLTAGQVVTLRAIISTNTNLQTGSARNYFTINKVG